MAHKFFNLTLLVISLLITLKAHTIADEVVSQEELIRRVQAFNDFYHKLNPSSVNLELRVEEDGAIRLHTLKDIEENEVYLTVNKDQMITHDYVHSIAPKYKDTLAEIEEMYGYDDMLNFAFAILIEKFNPESKWKPYIDILPIKPKNLVFDFWNTKNWAEPVLKGTTLISKNTLK